MDLAIPPRGHRAGFGRLRGAERRLAGRRSADTTPSATCSSPRSAQPAASATAIAVHVAGGNVGMALLGAPAFPPSPPRLARRRRRAPDRRHRGRHRHPGPCPRAPDARAGHRGPVRALHRRVLQNRGILRRRSPWRSSAAARAASALSMFSAPLDLHQLLALRPRDHRCHVRVVPLAASSLAPSPPAVPWTASAATVIVAVYLGGRCCCAVVLLPAG